METKKIWLLKASSDNIVPFICGAASTEAIANKIKADILEQFESLSVEVDMYITDACCINGTYHYCDPSLPEAEYSHPTMWLTHLVNDETDPFLCIIATTYARCENLVCKMKEFGSEPGENDGEYEFPYEYYTKSIMLDSVCVNGFRKLYI